MMKAALLASCTALATACLPTVAVSQEVSPDQSPEVGLGEIIVTAQRKEESAQRAAIAIDVVSPDELANAGVTNAGALNAVAPSLNVVQGGGSNSSFFVRGVGNFTNNAYSDPAVAYNYDGVYVGRPTATNGAFFDLARIEVLKGPQGTLYGRNATGGAVNVIPQVPRLGVTEGYVTAGFGNFDALDLEAAVNIPLGDDVAFRFAGKILDSDGYNVDGTNDVQSEAFRAQILAEPSDALSLRLAFDWVHIGGNGRGASYDGSMIFAPGTPASATAPANYVFVPSGLGPYEGLTSPASAAYFSQLVIGGSFNFPAPLDQPFLDDTNWGLTGEIVLDTGIGQLTAIAAHRRSSLDDLFNGPSFRGGRVDETDEQTSVEIRLDGESAGPIDWLVGAFYFDETTRGASTFNQYVNSSVQQYDVGTRSVAGFGRLTLNVSDTVRLVAAGRYTHDEKSIDGLAQNLLNLCSNAPPPFGPGCFGGPSTPVGLTLAEIAAAIPATDLPLGFPAGPGPANTVPFGTAGNILFYLPVAIDSTIKKDRFTYRLAAEWDVAPNSLVYASYETGYRSGGFSLSLGRETFDPEYIEAFTIGTKNRFLDNRLQLNIEAFYWRYRDQQVAHFGLDRLGFNSFFNENIGRSTIKGIDLDIQARATSTTLLTASVQYLDNRLDSFSYEVPRGPTTLPPAVGCPFAPGQDASGFNVFLVDCAGRRGYNSPEWSVNAGIRQDAYLGDYRLTLAADGRYRSSRVIGFDYLPQQIADSNFTVDASLTLAPDSEAWWISIWGRNLTDEVQPTITQYNASAGGTVSTVYAMPRTYGIRAGFNF